jgi:DNA-binding IclR family transcriptional regulator
MVTSVSRAANILRILGEGKNRLAEISKSLNLTTSTSHRLLKTLEKESFVIQDPVSRLYFLGPLILSLSANAMIAHQWLVTSAQREMHRLNRVTRETITLAIRVGAAAICLEQIESPQKIKYTVSKGATYPIYTGAAGKILLSELECNELEKLMAHLCLSPIGPKTITNKKELMRELKRVRKNGFATSDEETFEGAMALSAPIKGYVSPVAVTIIGPEYRMKGKERDYLGELNKSVQKIMHTISEINTI